MTVTTDNASRRCKLRVFFVGIDSYDKDENVLPYRSFIYFANSNDTIGVLRKGVERQFASMYPEDGHNEVVRLSDSHLSDIADNYLISDIFDESPNVYAKMRALSINENAPIPHNADGTVERPRIVVRTKRKRYTLTPLCSPQTPNKDHRSTLPSQMTACPDNHRMD
ncbi:hypothetical protein FB639_004728, partial [Coemansia asiatica]